MAESRGTPAGVTEKDDARVTGLRFAKILVWLVYAYFIVALIILTLAFFLLLFNASTSASFTQWVYRSANRVLEPFRGIFPTKSLGDSGSVIDFAVVFAIIMYGIFALVVHAIVGWLDGKILDLRASIAAQQAADRQRARAARTQPVGTWTEPGTPAAPGAGGTAADPPGTAPGNPATGAAGPGAATPGPPPPGPQA